MIKAKAMDIGFYLILLVVWQVVYYSGVHIFSGWKAYAFPNPVGVAECLIRLSRDGSLFLAVLYSLRRVGIGFGLALLLGGILGIAVVISPYLKRNLKPLLLGAQSLPSVCWVPFAILWFGLGESAIIFVVLMGALFSVALAIELAIRNIPNIYIKVARTMGASKKDILIYILIPAALPDVVAGLKQSWSFAWRALMAGEILSSCIGLGYTLIMGRNLADINQVMAVILVILVIGSLIDRIIFTTILNRIMKKRGI